MTETVFALFVSSALIFAFFACLPKKQSDLRAVRVRTDDVRRDVRLRIRRR